jgi:hypothetical protein
MATLLIFLYFFFGPYFIPVLITFFTVKRFGRGFHESDLLPMFGPSNLNSVELEADLCPFTVPPAALNFAR